MQLEERRVTVEEEMAEDDFFASISRNPFLGILLRHLGQLQGPNKVRLVNLLHIFLIEELQFKFKKREGSTAQS
jgi:hypothetical protein